MFSRLSNQKKVYKLSGQVQPDDIPDGFGKIFKDGRSIPALDLDADELLTLKRYDSVLRLLICRGIYIIKQIFTS